MRRRVASPGAWQPCALREVRTVTRTISFSLGADFPARGDFTSSGIATPTCRTNDAPNQGRGRASATRLERTFASFQRPTSGRWTPMPPQDQCTIPICTIPAWPARPKAGSACRSTRATGSRCAAHAVRAPAQACVVARYGTREPRLEIWREHNDVAHVSRCRIECHCCHASNPLERDPTSVPAVIVGNGRTQASACGLRCSRDIGVGSSPR